jgi:hypothetical protein
VIRTFVFATECNATLRQVERKEMDPYRVAYEQAMTELNEITRKFDLLRVQKAQVENLINAFRPLIENEQAANAIAG